jgi:hypothetical protein
LTGIDATITDDGRRTLEDAFVEPPAPAQPRNELLLRIFMGRHARDTEHLLRDVREGRGRAERTLAMLQAIEALSKGRRRHRPPLAPPEPALYLQHDLRFLFGIWSPVRSGW